MGVVSELKEKGEDEAGGENAREQRHAGMMVAVSVADPAQEKTALDVLRSFGAKEIERSEGEIIDGDWRDFDPLDIPDLIDRPRSTHGRHVNNGHHARRSRRRPSVIPISRRSS